jgi:acyl dehydratase
MNLHSLTASDNYFEDFTVGRRMRHARAATISEVENNLLSKQVMNTAQAHWNEEIMHGSPLGDGRLVFGLITASMTVGLSSQDTSENALQDSASPSTTATRSRHTPRSSP